MAVTAGTGSGKTEAFLLPIIASLLQESQRWTDGSPAGPTWWKTEGTKWTPQRSAERGRLPGIRSLILYPMNTLVEDQLVRLRRALDGEAATTWLDVHRGGHRFYFGRYTGKTPVSGDPQNKGAVRRLRRYLTEITRRSSGSRETNVASICPGWMEPKCEVVGTCRLIPLTS